MRKNFYSLTLLSMITLLVFSCRKEKNEANNNLEPATVHLTMGNPSSAVNDTSSYSNYLMVKSQYALSYNRDRGTPNWVSWHLDTSWLGDAPRQDDFRSDASLPSGWYRVQSTDYTNSGFDRGHMCPSADRTKTIEDNSATFLMTNMIPQAPNHNRQTWENLESYCRKLVEQGNELYIIMGNYGTGGNGSAGTKTSIAGGKITVPNRIWKVIVVLPESTGDAGRVTTSTRVIAINTPNINTVNSSWGIYRTSVDEIESATGYNILSAVSENVQKVIEARVDDGPTQ